MECGPLTGGLAYFALAYLLASVLYLIITRACVGTPFNDSLSAEQREIKASSARDRKRIFFVSILLAILMLALTRPLR